MALLHKEYTDERHRESTGADGDDLPGAGLLDAAHQQAVRRIGEGSCENQQDRELVAVKPRSGTARLGPLRIRIRCQFSGLLTAASLVRSSRLRRIEARRFFF